MRVGGQFCPGVLYAVPAKDGLLVRIRVPGGLIEPHQLRAVADASQSFADGTIEITSRANLQLRAIRNKDLSSVVERIVCAGLLPSPQHDRVRNIVGSPLAGLDPSELIDPRPLVHELDRNLQAKTIFADLHPKFSFAVHSSPRRFSRDHDDISLEAMKGDAAACFHLYFGGAASGFVVQQEDAVGCMWMAAKICIELAKAHRVPVRTKRVMEIPGAMESIVDALARVVTSSPLPPAACFFEEALLGVYPTRQPGRVSIIPSVPLGRLTAQQAHHIADIATEWAGDLRLAPWRGVVLGSVLENAAGNIVARLHSLGLSCDGRDGFRGIAACAGSTGCEASLADVRADATALAQRLAGIAVPAGWTVNLSGCEKQCALRHSATVALIAGASGYVIKIDGQAAASHCPPELAIETIAALHAHKLYEAAS